MCSAASGSFYVDFLKDGTVGKTLAGVFNHRSSVLVRISIAVMNHHDQKQLEEERV